MRRSRSARASYLVNTIIALMAGPVWAGDNPPAAHGIVPQGIWVLNAARSHSLNTGRQTLWVIKDDGLHLVWVSAMIDAAHRVQVVSYDGAYGGPAAAVTGSAMTTQIVATGATTLHNFGTITGVGSYAEDCRVTHAGKRFRCAGQVTTAHGTLPYVDDFDWYAASPPAARP